MNQQATLPQDKNNGKSFRKLLRKYRKTIVITVGITVLNLVFGFDARFTFINLLWLLV